MSLFRIIFSCLGASRARFPIHSNPSHTNKKKENNIKICNNTELKYKKIIHKTIKGVGDDLEKIKFNNLHFVTNKEAEMIKLFRNNYLKDFISSTTKQLN